jgi:Phosphatidylglycerophosphate synthase
LDSFNKKERRTQKAFAVMRDKLFTPLVILLQKIGVTPNQVTLLGVVFLVLACLVPPDWYKVAIVFVVLNVTCDGIDGPLARRKGLAHPGGSLVDIVADQLGVVFLPAAAIYHLNAFGPVMLLFSSAYLLFIGLVVYANELGLEVRLFIRSKYPFYVLYLFCLYQRVDWVTYFCGAFVLYYSVESFFTLRKIYRYFGERAKGDG